MTDLASVLKRKLIFVSGKGGVGKTVVSQAVAQALAARGKRVLWTAFEDPTRPAYELKQVKPNLWHFNCEAGLAFEEYAGLKIGTGALTRVFVQNKLMRYLAKAAPGIHELVLLGKVWYDRLNYDAIVIDMPSTGYGLAMFQSTENFARLFQGGPIHRDAEAMIATFEDAGQTGHLIVSLPEEMPLQESIELHDFLLERFPKNPSAFLVNRRFPKVDVEHELPEEWPEPLARNAEDYSRKRSILENHNLRLWRNKGFGFGELGYVPPPVDNSTEPVVSALAAQLGERGYL